ncbi:putative Transmembrane protein [Quillaja saponaria]|uniref:Transmembrane protein n=1 Tax=Quillaja saponaria TaxID=32244 RepID=A0AAD7QIN2_QUISA|nr:putative Transmembrane protein [Quillaja saponaria]
MPAANVFQWDSHAFFTHLPNLIAINIIAWTFTFSSTVSDLNLSHNSSNASVSLAYCRILSPIIAMAPVSSFKALAVVFVVAIFAAVASAQDFDLSPSSSPAPSPDAGAAGSVSTSMAMIGASILLSVLAVLKQ